MPLSNVLYVTVLPIVRLPKHRGLGVFDKIGSFGSPPRGILDFTSTETVEPVEQVLTLFSDRNLATEFFENEVHDYLRDFQEVANKYLRGGHVVSYEFAAEKTDDGRYVIRVTQNVK
jgi:hypothetical protein